jgi:hypothetical protein
MIIQDDFFNHITFWSPNEREYLWILFLNYMKWLGGTTQFWWWLKNLLCAHFIPIIDTYKTLERTKVFIKEIVILHGFPKKIISYREFVFIGRFWTSFCPTLQTQLNFITYFIILK